MPYLEDDPYETLFEYGDGTMRERHDEYMTRKTAEENIIATDKQVGGKHYKDCAIQPIDFILANNFGFCEGNIIKYTTRHNKRFIKSKSLCPIINLKKIWKGQLDGIFNG